MKSNGYTTTVDNAVVRYWRTVDGTGWIVKYPYNEGELYYSLRGGAGDVRAPLNATPPPYCGS